MKEQSVEVLAEAIMSMKRPLPMQGMTTLVFLILIPILAILKLEKRKL